MRFAILNNGEETLHPPDFKKKKRPRFSFTNKEMTSTIFAATMILLT
jgi:hypothetical protein